MTKITWLTGVALCTLGPGGAIAQDAFVLDEIVVSSNLEATEAEKSGATVSVITEDELEATGETRVVDFLARVPGVSVITRGPIGTVSGITVRGASQNYVKVFVDGIDVSDPSATQVFYDFGALTTTDVSRIEVLRGAQTGYGSEAIGGVINITTRRAEADGVTHRTALEAGSYNTLRGSYSYAARDGENELAATLSAITTDGYSAAEENEGNSEADGYEARRISLSGSTVLENGVRLGATAFAEASEGEFDEGFPVADGVPDNVTDNTSLGFRVFSEFAAGGIDHTIAATYYNIERDVTGTDGGFGSNNLYEGTRIGLSYLGAADLGNGRLRFGADVTRETYAQSGDFGPAKANNRLFGVFGEYAFPAGAQTDVITTLRYDNHDVFGGFLTGRIAGVYRASDDLIFRSVVATAFRAPSNYELLGPFGEPSLEPEESRSFDLGVERRIGQNAVRATLFYLETDNLIDFPFPYAQVPGTVKRKGIEFEGDFSVSETVQLTAAYTYTDADNPSLTAGNTWNTVFPAHDLSLTFDATFGDRVGGTLTAQHVAGREGLDDYSLINAGLRYEISSHSEVYLRVENLFDEEYQLRESYGTSDRAFYIGLRASF